MHNFMSKVINIFRLDLNFKIKKKKVYVNNFINIFLYLFQPTVLNRVILPKKKKVEASNLVSFPWC